MQKDSPSEAVQQREGDSLTQTKTKDPYDLQPQIQPVDEHTQTQLITSAKAYHHAQQQFKKQDFFSHSHIYIISKRWLKRWKIYVSYDEVIQNKSPSKLLGCGDLPKINADIVEEMPKNTLQYQSKKYEHYDIKMKDNLVEGIDIEFVDEEMWNILQEKISSYPVKRFIESGQDGKIVQTYYQKITLIPVCMDTLKSIEQERMTKLKEVYFYFSKYRTVQEFLEAGSKILSDWIEKQQRIQIGVKDYIKLWKMPEGTRKTIILNTFLQGCKANPSFTYKLFLDGEYIQDKQMTINDLDIVKDTIIVAELRQYRQVWCFYNLKHKLKASCSYCKKQEELTFVCSCKYAAYCTKQCKSYDKSHHKYRCPNEAQSDQEQKQLKYNENSKRGLVGLRNLGNTCFMNSGLQCLSHVKVLTDYFLKNQYLKDINRTNVLGTQGQLSTEYAKMIKNLYFGDDSSFSPHHLKKSIGKFQPMFSGYNQHDSGQLITYLLDGLHQDLNRVKEKPYTQIKDYDGRADHLIAQQSWQIFLKRNQSIIVDLMYGQFKSIVECPTQSCKNVSITFDPFSACTLPLIDNTKKKIEINYIKQFIYSKKFFLSYGMDKDYTLQEKLSQLKDTIGVQQDSRTMVYVSSYSTCEIINIKQYVNDIRKEYSYRSLYIRELNPDEDLQLDIKVMVANVVNNSYYSGEQYRKNIAPYQLFFVNKNLTNKQVYFKIINSYARILNQKSLDQATFEQKYIKQDTKDDICRIIMIPASRYYTCSYCGQKNCSGCKLPYNDQPFAEYIKYSAESQYDRDKKYDMQLYWRKDEKEIQKIFDQIKEDNDNNFATGPSGKGAASSGGTSIYDCLKQFEKEETLGQDNAWYCPKCKEFVLAKKQMRIYKAPKILILCLKRFKRKQYFSEKISTLVDFPIEGLDLTNYISNTDLPFQTYSQKTDQQKKALYDLIGISNHFGSTGGGHYTAYCKDDESGSWYDFDDSSVGKLRSAEDAVTESAYILFYKRRQ